jgi:hypothetical protein
MAFPLEASRSVSLFDKRKLVYYLELSSGVQKLQEPIWMTAEERS